jgi:choline dehydrogenase
MLKKAPPESKKVSRIGKAQTEPKWEGEFDFIVVGSGAGGAPVAANLARNGFSVALLEAGGTDEPSNYAVPALNPKACEDPRLSWEFVVRHYRDDTQQKLDTKTIGKWSPALVQKFKDKFGIFYPRAGTLGGCTTHNALVTIQPHRSDWDRIAYQTSDDSWRATKMEQYFEKLERCQYCGDNPNRSSYHGLVGWLPTNIARPKLITRDWKAFRIVWATLLSVVEGNVWSHLRYFWQTWRRFPDSPPQFLLSYFDPNDLRTPSFEREGMFYVPFSTEVGRRASVRDLLKQAQDQNDKLTIFTNTLVTQILFVTDEAMCVPLDLRLNKNDPNTLKDVDENLKAIGVKYLEGCHYIAAPDAIRKGRPPWPLKESSFKFLRARKEVILAGGAFNSPQLLMLSGVGPRAQLESHEIRTLKNRAGVGENLQDRYEVGVVCEAKEPFTLTRGAKFRAPKIGDEPDPLFKEWLVGKGPYTTNGVLICFTKRAKNAAPNEEPDLFVFCVLGNFRGYFPGFSDRAYDTSNFTWLILKAHTRFRGRVRLNSDPHSDPPRDPRDPRELPEIEFNYFPNGEPGTEADLEAMVDGIEFVRNVNSKLFGIISEELVPGPNYDTREKLKQFVKNEAWGHHASCTNKMGRSGDESAVVDSHFKVFGTENLRIVDASVFPDIPGFYIVAPIYMIAEKASDLIVAEHRNKMHVQNDETLLDEPAT